MNELWFIRAVKADMEKSKREEEEAGSILDKGKKMEKFIQGNGILEISWRMGLAATPRTTA